MDPVSITLLAYFYVTTGVALVLLARFVWHRHRRKGGGRSPLPWIIGAGLAALVGAVTAHALQDPYLSLASWLSQNSRGS